MQHFEYGEPKSVNLAPVGDCYENYGNDVMSGVFDRYAGTLRAVIGQSEPCTNLTWLPPAPRRLLVVVRF